MSRRNARPGPWLRFRRRHHTQKHLQTPRQAEAQLLLVGVDAAKTVSLRVYYVDMKVDDEHSSVPRVELVPMGPDIDWALRRTHLASHDLEKLAMRVPSQCVRAAAAAISVPQPRMLDGVCGGAPQHRMRGVHGVGVCAEKACRAMSSARRASPRAQTRSAQRSSWQGEPGAHALVQRVSEKAGVKGVEGPGALTASPSRTRQTSLQGPLLQ